MKSTSNETKTRSQVEVWETWSALKALQQSPTVSVRLFLVEFPLLSVCRAGGTALFQGCFDNEPHLQSFWKWRLTDVRNLEIGAKQRKKMLQGRFYYNVLFSLAQGQVWKRGEKMEDKWAYWFSGKSTF